MPKSGTATISLPIGLKSFKLKYNGDAAITSQLNIHCVNPLNTVSVTGVDINLDAESSVSIRNRVNASAFGLDASTVSILEGFQSDLDMYKCKGGTTCDPFSKKTGLNALAIVDTLKNNTDNFELTVEQEPFDYGPLQVMYVEGINPKKIQNLISLAKLAGYDISNVPVEQILALLTAGKNNLMKIEGSAEYALYGLTQDVKIDSVYFNREFSAVANARSTIAFPFSIATDSIKGVSEILQFTRIGQHEGKDVVFMKKVYCFERTEGDKCPAKNGTLEAYKPYIIQLQKGVTSLEFVNSKEKKGASVTLRATPTESDYADFADPNSYWVFRGVFEKHTWKEAPANTYGYAASGKDEKGNDLAGKFVKVGDGAYIYPFRGVLTYAPPSKIAPANSSYALRPNVLPDEMNIVVEGDNNETTVIGSFNTRTGEMNFINNMKHTYDLKGRRVNGVNNARGAYYGKKVMR